MRDLVVRPTFWILPPKVFSVWIMPFVWLRRCFLSKVFWPLPDPHRWHLRSACTFRSYPESVVQLDRRRWLVDKINANPSCCCGVGYRESGFNAAQLFRYSNWLLVNGVRTVDAGPTNRWKLALGAEQWRLLCKRGLCSRRWQKVESKLFVKERRGFGVEVVRY